MSSLYTQIHLSLTVTGGSLVVASDSTPGAEFPVYVAVMGGSWLQDTYQNWIPAGYYPLLGDDAEEVVHQAQQVGLEEGSLQRLADVISDMADRQITDTMTGISDDDYDPALLDPFAVDANPTRCPVCSAEMIMDYDGGELVCSADDCDARQSLDGVTR